MNALFSLRLPSLFLALILIYTGSAQAGKFKNPALIDTVYDPVGVATADFNHDGNLDLAYIDGQGSFLLHVLMGNGDGTFVHKQDRLLPAGICGYSDCVINLADVTNDGNVDIILGGAGTSTTQLAVLAGNGDGTFQSAVVTTLPKGSSYYPALEGRMGVGDVNGDGIADIVVADRMNPALYVMLGDNSGHFTVKEKLTIYFTGQPRVYLQDLNGDGALDIVAIDPPPGGVAHILLGKGDGTFQPSVDYSYLPEFLADMDNDGHPDLVCVQYTQTAGYVVTLATGNPDGSFNAPSQVASAPGNAPLMFIGDYNGDGLPDLIFSVPVGIATMPSLGNLSYGTAVPTVAGASGWPSPFVLPADLALGDFNHDGKNDLAMGVDGGILILLGNGDGSFASADSYDVGSELGAAVVADFNGDRKPDIAVTVQAAYPRLLLNTGSGTFTLAPDQNQSYSSQTPASNLVAADFNGDGKLDLLSTQSPTGSFPNGQTVTWFNTGNDTFSSSMNVGPGPALSADVNKDGRSDVTFIGNYGTITAMLGQTNSTFTTVTTQQWQGAYQVAAIGDVNNDGKADLLLYQGLSLRLWLGNGDGTFSVSNLVTIPYQGSFGIFGGQLVRIADIDGDGRADIVIAPASNSGSVMGPLLFLYGNGDGTFQSPQQILLSRPYTQFVIADINGDGKPDMVMTDGSGIAVITNLGSRTYSAEDHYVGGQGISQLNVVDVNGDGFPDIVTANAGGTTVTVLLNQPNGKSLDGSASAGTFNVAPTPSNYSQPITLQLAMSPASGAATPTGSVTFYVDGSFIATPSLVSGSASFVYTNALAPGMHTFLAAYSGDSTYGAESFATLQTVNPPVYATTTLLTANPATVMASRTVRLTATITSPAAVPGGWVTFLDGTNSLGAKQVNSKGVALLDTATLTAGAHHISAVYQGYQDPWNLHAIYQPSTSGAVPVTVSAISTSTAISGSGSSATAGTVVTLTANVTAASSTPFGGVSFFDGATLLGTASLTSGSANFSTASLSTGSHRITATFNANAIFAASTSPVLNITVTAASATLENSVVALSLQASGSPTLQARISTLDGSTTGAVTFLDAGRNLGTSTLDVSGNAALATSLENGNHSLSASFGGNAQYAPADSPELVEEWPASGPGFSLALSGNSMTVSASHSDALSVRVNAIGSFQQSIDFRCASGVPTGYACSFSPAKLDGTGTALLTLQPVSNGLSSRRAPRWAYPVVLTCFLLSFIRVRGKYLRSFLFGLALSVTAVGCGNPPSAIGHAQLHVLSIQVTSGNGANQIVHSAQVIVKSVQ